MLTKNFYSLMNSRLSGQNATIAIPSGGTKSFGANEVHHVNNGTSFYKAFTTDYGVSSRNSFPGVRYGTGSSPATADDTDLESVIPEQSLKVIMPSEATVNFAGEYLEYTTTISVQNLTSAAITISEIGLFPGAYSGGNITPFLVDRTVLDEPITIPAGQSKQITYTIRFNYGA